MSSVLPPVIRSYQKVLDWINSGHELEVMIPPQIPESDIFKNKPSNSIEGKLFKFRSTFMDDEVELTRLPFLPQDRLINLELVAILREMSLEVPLSMYLT